MQDNGSNSTGQTGNKAVHAQQRSLVHYAELHPANSEGRSRAFHLPPGRRYCLSGLAMSEICDRVERSVQSELQEHAGLTIEYIAHYAALAAERAIQHVGVERTL